MSECQYSGVDSALYLAGIISFAAILSIGVYSWRIGHPKKRWDDVYLAVVFTISAILLIVGLGVLVVPCLGLINN
jgi:hypothetical protein